MLGWTIVAALALATAAQAAPEPGRTDGPEGSEYGRGGYARWRSEGNFYLEGFLGSATVDIEGSSQTDLVAGLNAGYLVEDWLGFQLGFARIADQETRFYSGGVRSAFAREPFAYYFSLEAEIYDPEAGEARFGIAPGAGAEVILHEHVRAGLRFQRDFVFADESIGINRFTAKLQFDF